MPSYKNGNYIVSIFADGTKIRKTEDDEFIPSFSENCDVKITDKCSQACAFCYEGCTAAGKHGDLLSYPFIHSLHPYTELAMNGNDLDHPQLTEFLEILKQQKVFGNITVNQNQFIDNYDRIVEFQKNGLVHGIGVSVISGSITDDFIRKVKSVKNTVLHTIVGILSEDDIQKLRENDLKILLLGYKDLQRGINYRSSHKDSIDTNIKYVYEHLEEMTGWFKVVSFDNLAITQLDVKRIMSDEDWNEFYMGDDGKYTFYIDMVSGTFSKNSISQERFPISDKSIDDMFNFILEKYK